MNVTPTDLPEVLLIEPTIFSDDRGFFFEAFNKARFQACGLATEFPQDNYSRSVRHALRGLHYQLEHPQGKLVTCVAGEIYDVAVDIRRGSPTFTRWVATRLRADAPRYLWIPAGFAHGFCAVSEVAAVIYKCTAVYHAEDDRGLLWNDPVLNIPWPTTHPLLSAKDQRYLPLDPDRADLPVYVR